MFLSSSHECSSTLFKISGARDGVRNQVRVWELDLASFPAHTEVQSFEAAYDQKVW